MAERQQVQDLAQLRELLAPPGERHADTIDGTLVVTGADGKRYEVPMSFIAPLVEAYARLRMSVAELSKFARTFDDPKAPAP